MILDDFIRMNQPTWEYLPDLVFVKDTDLVYQYVNSTYKSVFSPIKDLLGKKDIDLDDKEQGKKVQATDLEVLNTGKTVITTVEHFQNPENYYRVVKSPIFNLTGEMIGILGSARPISEHIIMMKDAKKNLSLIEKLMESIPYPIFFKDTDGKYQIVNKRLVEDVGIKREDIIGKSDSELFDKKSDWFTETDQRVMASRKSETFITKGVKGNKNLVSKDVVLDDKGKILGIIGIINPYLDVEDVKEDMLIRQRMHSMKELGAGFAHHLNNKLTIITGMASILINEEMRNQEIVNDGIEEIYKTAKEIGDIIHNFRTFTQQEVSEVQKVNIQELVDQITNELAIPEDKDITIIKKISLKSNEIDGDIFGISTAIKILLENAIEAIHEYGQITVETSNFVIDTSTVSFDSSEFLLRPDTVIDGDYVCIEIKDSGVGIDPLVISRIFNPYFTTKSRKVGLGLAVVFGVINQHQGFLAVKSEVGKGTKFRLFLRTTNSREETDSN